LGTRGRYQSASVAACGVCSEHVLGGGGRRAPGPALTGAAPRRQRRRVMRLRHRPRPDATRRGCCTMSSPLEREAEQARGRSTSMRCAPSRGTFYSPVGSRALLLGRPHLTAPTPHWRMSPSPGSTIGGAGSCRAWPVSPADWHVACKRRALLNHRQEPGGPVGPVGTIIALVGVVIPLGAQSARAQQQAIDPTWLSFNAAARTARFQLIAGLTGLNGALNFNGFSDGGLTFVVPVGWQTEIDFRNHDGMLPHSAEIINPSTPLPVQSV